MPCEGNLVVQEDVGRVHKDGSRRHLEGVDLADVFAGDLVGAAGDPAVVPRDAVEEVSVIFPIRGKDIFDERLLHGLESLSILLLEVVLLLRDGHDHRAHEVCFEVELPPQEFQELLVIHLLPNLAYLGREGFHKV